jgi:hypothetical protein
MTESARRTSRLRRLRELPWFTHIGATTAFFAWGTWSPIHEYGLDRSGPWAAGAPMSAGILLFAVAVTSPLVLLETWASARSEDWGAWTARAAAAISAGVLAWFGTAPIGLQLGGGPVSQADVEMAASSSLLIAGLYLIVLMTSAAWRRAA